MSEKEHSVDFLMIKLLHVYATKIFHQLSHVNLHPGQMPMLDILYRQEGLSQRIYLTDSGKEIHREVEKIRKEVGSVMLQGMTPEEVDHLKKQILQMQENMEKMPGSTEIKDYL